MTGTSVPEVFYRYEEVVYSPGVDQFDEPLAGPGRLEVVCRDYRVIRRTPKGAWIEGASLSGNRFVLLTANKQYACETKERAMESFRARKRRQIKILIAQLDQARRALRLTQVPADEL